jgi:hypothetical protein
MNMARFQKNRMNFNVGGAKAHKNSGNANSNKNKNKNKPKSKDNRNNQSSTINNNKTNAAQGNAHPHVNSLENDLDNILSASSLAKHIDPPSAELDDEFSRLKTQCMQLATLVLELQNRLEFDEPRRKKQHHPEAIAVGRSLVQNIPISDKIRTTTVEAPPIQNTQTSATDPLSIIYSSTPKAWSGKRTSTKLSKSAQFPQTPRTAGMVGTPMSAQMASPSSTRLTPTLDRLLDEIHDAFQARDGDRIALDLRIEPPLGQAYSDLAQELRKHYPWGSADKHLRTLCEKVLPIGPDGVRKEWDTFVVYLLSYLQFIRDYSLNNNLLKHNNDLKILLKWVRHAIFPTLTFAD